MFPIFPEGRGGGSLNGQINLLMAADCFMRNAILAEYQYTGFTISYSIFPGMVKKKERQKSIWQFGNNNHVSVLHLYSPLPAM